MNKNMNKLSGKNIIKYAAIGSYLLGASYLLGSAKNGQSICSLENPRSRAEKNVRLSRDLSSRRVERLQTLIDDGANVNAQRIDGYVPLHYAAERGYPEVVEALLGVPNINVNAKDFLGETAIDKARKGLERAGQAGDQESQARYQSIVDLLCEHGGKGGADIEIAPSAYEQLLAAIWKGDVERIKASIAAGADVKAEDGNGWTPLYRAAVHGDRPKVIEALLAAGADVNTKTENGVTALEIAERINAGGMALNVALEGPESIRRNQEGNQKSQAAVDLLRGHGGNSGGRRKVCRRS